MICTLNFVVVLCLFILNSVALVVCVTAVMHKVFLYVNTLFFFQLLIIKFYSSKF